MALTPPTVTADPAIPSETNTAMAAINAFVETAKTETLTGLRVIREHLRLTNGSNAMLDELDAAMAVVGAAAETDPTIATSPAVQAETNAALATLGAIDDLLNARSVAAIGALRNHARVGGGYFERLEAFDTSRVNLTTPLVQTAVTVASDPVTKAHMDAALASVTALIDTSNAEIVAALQTFTQQFRLMPANQTLNNQLAGAIAALQSP
jgi:hypothetical protein